MEIIAIAIVGTLNVVCFLIGAKVGQMASRGESININPIDNAQKKAAEKEEKKKADLAQQRADIIRHNIDTYNGTSQGQRDVPRL